MKLYHVRDDILKLFRKHKRPLSVTEVANGLRLKGSFRKRAQRWLQKMVENGELFHTGGSNYSIEGEETLDEGVIHISRRGDGYVTIPGMAEDILVPRKRTSRALPGDLVLIRIATVYSEDNGDARQEGTVVRVITRAEHTVVGTVKCDGYLLDVLPLAPGYRQPFRVEAVAGVGLDDRVVVKFTAWREADRKPCGEIVEVLGPSTDPSTDTIGIMRQFDLDMNFPEEVDAAAQAACEQEQDIEGRTDMRDELVITIDPTSARDYDDALSIQRKENGNRVLGVHIADVSYYVAPSSPLDVEAARRGNSVYLVDRVVPMLPEALSNLTCSLQPDKHRLTVSVFIELDTEGNTVSETWNRSVIVNKARLTYEQAQEMIELDNASKHDTPEVAQLVRDLDALAQNWRAQRMSRHALDLALPECEVVLQPDGSVATTELLESDRSHQLVEECMVAANEAVARELANRSLPYISRYHPPPRSQKIEFLESQLMQFGYHPGDLSERSNLSKFLDSVHHDPLIETVHRLVLRSMSRASYSAAHQGHFGLAKHFYAHFTSPIRRYPDLTIHRQLLATDTPAHSAEQLTAIAHNCTLTETRADEAERMLTDIKKLRYLDAQVTMASPRSYAAVVVNVRRFGVFVEVQELQLQGLVHASQLTGAHMRFSRSRNRLEGGGKTMQIGDKLRVFPISVDMDERKVDFGVETR